MTTIHWLGGGVGCLGLGVRVGTVWTGEEQAYDQEPAPQPSSAPTWGECLSPLHPSCSICKKKRWRGGGDIEQSLSWELNVFKVLSWAGPLLEPSPSLGPDLTRVALSTI